MLEKLLAFGNVSVLLACLTDFDLNLVDFIHGVILYLVRIYSGGINMRVLHFGQNLFFGEARM